MIAAVAFWLLNYFGVISIGGSRPIAGMGGAVVIATAVPTAPAAPSSQMAVPAVSEETVILVAPATVTPGVTAVELIAVTAVATDLPQAVYDCMRAAAEGRRSNPGCRDILNALGDGR